MITFAFERERRVILIRFALAFTRETLARLAGMTQRFVALEGPADSIVDFSDALPSVVDMALVHEQTHRPLVMPGQRRVFVAPGDQLYGLLRVYAAHQAVEPLVVRTPAAAFEYFDVVATNFQPIDLDSARD